MSRLRAHWRSLPPRLVAWLPVVLCLLVVCVLGTAKVNGSSVSLYGDNAPAAGQARPIRTDEYLTRTPLAVRQVVQGFPVSTTLGNGQHDTGVLSDLPERGWPMVLRPQTTPYHLFDVERAFAFEWWLIVAAPFLGVYWLVMALTRRVGLGVLAGAAIALSPAVVWWSIPAGGMTIGAAAAAAAALVEAGRAGRARSAVGFGALAGWALAVLATGLYVPWTLGMALVLFPVAVVGWTFSRRQATTRVPWWCTVGPLAAVAGMLTLGFLLRHQDALAAIGGTVYPGDRRSAAGELAPRLLFAAPFDWFTTRLPIVGVSGTNQSEAASGLVLWLPLLIANLSMLGWWRAPSLVRRACAAVATSTVVLLVWGFVPLPTIVGRLTLLDRIPHERLYQPLMVAGVLLAALVAAAHREQPVRVHRVAAAVAVAAMFAVSLWAGLVMRIDGEPVSRVGVVLLALAATAVAALVVTGRGVAGLVVAVALTAFSTARINPVQVGLGPLLDAPLMQQIERVDPALRALPWLEDGEADDAVGVLNASGLALLSGFSWYPDDAAWLRVDPDREYVDVWNRLAHVRFDLTPDDSPLQITLPYPDVVLLVGGVCSEGVRALQPGVIVTDQPMDVPCLEPVEPAPTRPGELLLYRYVAG